MKKYKLTVEVISLGGGLTSANLVGAESQGLTMPKEIIEKLKDKGRYGAIKKLNGYKDPEEFRIPGIYKFEVELNTPELFIENK